MTLEFEDENGAPIELTRKWHFASNGQHKPYDDELLIFEGYGRRPVAPPAMETDRDGWYREYIANMFIPAPLAEFFLFDGEQVQRYANRGMSGQIRSGIEGLLGLPVLRSLRESLQRYAQARRSSAASPSDEKVRVVKAEIDRLEQEIAANQRVVEEVDSLLPGLQSESDELVQRLGGGGEGTMAMVADLIREEERFRSDASRQTEALMKLLAEDVSLALAGAKLREQTVKRLQAEELRESWESGRNQGNVKLDRYVADLSDRVASLEPPIERKQREDVLDAARAAWEDFGTRHQKDVLRITSTRG